MFHAPSSASAPLDPALWERASPLASFIAGEIQSAELWRTTERLSRLSPSQEARAAAVALDARLLVLLEDWCGDAIFTVPFMQRIADANPRLELRVLSRDQHDELMATHLTGTARSIPVVMVFDATGAERAWWGPRPAPLQAWMLLEGLTLEKPERYRGVRTWYARDRGTTTVSEVLAMLEHVAASHPAAGPTPVTDQVSPVASPE